MGTPPTMRAGGEPDLWPGQESGKNRALRPCLGPRPDAQAAGVVSTDTEPDGVDEAVADGAPAPATHARRRRWPWVVLVVAGVVVVLLAGAAALVVFGGNPPEEASVDEARERFRPSDADRDGVTPFERPAQGIYVYDGTGTEDTSFPPVEEDQGPSMPATVTWSGDDCWTFRIDYNTNHWQSWDYCATPDRLEEHGGVTFQRRDYTVLQVDSTSTFVCEPPAPIIEWEMQEGDRLAASCQGSNDVIAGETTSSGENELVGTEVVDIGGEAVDALHVRSTREITGAQEGIEHRDTWFDARTGLPLRQTHDIDVSTDTPFGGVDYHEVSEWTLTSLEPET